MTPYQYGANNPIKYIDINGDSLRVAGSDSAIESFQQVVSNGTGGFYSASVGDDGLVSITATGKEGEISKTQQNFADVMTNSASLETGLSEFSLVDHSDKASKGIIVGDNGESDISATPGVHTIDMGDVQKFGSDGLLTSQGALAHEISEGFEIQVNGTKPMNAHRKALRTESRVNGIATLGGTINSSRTELRVRVQAGFNDVRNVIFKVKGGNIKKIGNNKR